nr:MAG TPA: hypothetical protein [Bacteriophage sp.]
MLPNFPPLLYIFSRATRKEISYFGKFERYSVPTAKACKLHLKRGSKVFTVCHGTQ